jgi:Icc-related predicted phosphoesterase
MRIVCISDTHGKHSEITFPRGDVLVVAGDVSQYGTLGEFHEFNRLLKVLPYKHKILVAGNHDRSLELDRYPKEDINAYYLEDSEVIIEGIKFYGSPYQPEFCNWAFNLPRNGPELQAKWDAIPEDTDVLITHTAPYGILDPDYSGQSCGCEMLLHRVCKVKPRYHIFGHLHEGYGKREGQTSSFYNCSLCNDQYRLMNKPIVFDIEIKK